MDWIVNNIEWVIIIIALPFFLKAIFTELLPSLRKTSKHGDDDPAGNDNIKRDFHDYM